MLQIELVGGPRCGDRLTLEGWPTFPAEYERTTVQHFDVGGGKIAERATTFTYEQSWMLPKRDGRVVYEFKGYRDGVSTGA